MVIEGRLENGGWLSICQVGDQGSRGVRAHVDPSLRLFRILITDQDGNQLPGLGSGTDSHELSKLFCGDFLMSAIDPIGRKERGSPANYRRRCIL